MGSEGYLINEFLAARTNQRDDEWGGDYARRMRFAVEVVRAVRERAGADFIIIFRLSMLDLVEGGGTFDETVQLAQAIESRGRHDYQHRHRLARGAHPDHRHAGAARGVQLGNAQAERQSVRSAGHHQPH